MDRILIISDCFLCPFFDNEYYTYEEKCIKLDRVIEGIKQEGSKYINIAFPIPDDCPLEIVKDENNV